MERNKALDRARKCLALAKDSRADPNEAAAALRQAQKIMEAAGISEDDIEAAEIREAMYRSKVSASRQHGWETMLCQLIERCFGVRALYSKGQGGRTVETMFASYKFIGPEAQAELAAYTMDVLSRQIMKGRAKHLKELNMGYSRSQLAQMGDGYCLGFVKALDSKVEKFAGIDRSKAIQLYIDRNFRKITPGKELVLRGDADSLAKGYADGKNAYLNKPVNGDQLRRLQ